MSTTNNDWNADDEGDEDDEYGYDNDDGDDFGLPSMSSMKRKTKKAADVTTALREKGVLMSSVGPQAVRLVTHHDADAEACATAAEKLKEVLG